MMVKWVHMFFLRFKAADIKEDNPNWWQSMNGTFSNEYWKAAFKEIKKLEEMEAWEVLDRTEEINFIVSKWDLKWNNLLMN